MSVDGAVNNTDVANVLIPPSIAVNGSPPVEITLHPLGTIQSYL